MSSGNVPRLRFGEFEGEWEEKELLNISNFVNEKILLEKLTLKNYISTENLLSDFSGVTKSLKFPKIKSVTHFKKDDILISNIRPYLKKIWLASFDGGASNDVIVVRAKGKTDSKYLSFVLMRDDFIDYVMRGAKGVKMPRGDMSLIKQYPLYVPKQKEQQKIANCLNSIDRLITAQRKKVEALKKHKKGLMQKLFPREGESVPELRFGGFDGEWEEKILQKLADRITLKNKDEKVTYVLTNSAAEGIIDQREYFKKDIANKSNLNNYFVVNKGDYIYNPRISIIAPVGPISKNKIQTGVMSPLYTVFRFTNKNNDFYEHYFKTTLWHKYIRSVSNSGARHDRMSITNNHFMNMPILNPSPNEQQKIADCLNSIDSLVASETSKVKTLKEHKKGLMQQLFPSNKGIQK